MPLLNLSLVTQALLKVIELAVKASPEWPPMAVLTVSPLPPDALAGENAIGLYLYHIVEDPHYKNLPAPGTDDVPVRYTPMGLQLNYQLTAHSDLEGDPGTFREQLLMGLALKALRDYPVLDDGTTVSGTTVFPGPLAHHDNRVRISLQPVPANDAVQYWTAGSHPLRLAAYYEVSIALLEPEQVSSRAGRVLSYGVYTLLRGAPRLDGSSNVVTFTVPGDPNPREVELRPAEVAVDAQVTFFGTGLADQDTRLLVRGPQWPDAVEVDPVLWAVSATEDRVVATVRSAAGTNVVLPGIYEAMVRVIAQRTMPDGSPKQFVKVSNATPFSIAPRIDAIGPFVAGLSTVTGFGFDPAALPGDAIQVYVGPQRLERVAAPPAAAGQFSPVDVGTLQFRLPAGLAPGSVLPWRVLVRGAESGPQWVTVP